MNEEMLRNQKAGQDKDSGIQISHLGRRYNTQTEVDLAFKATFCQNQEASYIPSWGRNQSQGTVRQGLQWGAGKWIHLTVEGERAKIRVGPGRILDEAKDCGSDPT